MESKIVIREEVPEDIEAVFQVNSEAFKQNAEAVLVDALRSSEAFIPGLSLVAVLNNELVGHILFTGINIVSENHSEAESLALAPMAVKPGFQNRGIGSALIRSGLKKAAELGYQSVIVLGHDRYYPKFGFVPASKWNIRAPFEVPESAFMGIELVKDGLTNVTGVVRYTREFDNI